MIENNKRKKIVLIGPVYPFKGGISHYTGLMYKALEKKYKVTMVSYRFQYPKFLYKKEQKDYSNDNFKIANTKYWLHTANPVNWIITSKKIKEIEPDLVIIQWWHPYFAPCYWSLGKCLKQVKILFVCHNVFPHERFPLDHLLVRNVLRLGDYYLVQSGTDAKDLCEIIKDSKYKQIVHPTYNSFKMKGMSKSEARKQLHRKEDEKVILFFGFIRDYKGLKYLIQAMPEIIQHLPEVKLLIVGDFKNQSEKDAYMYMITCNNLNNYIEVFDGYIPDKEVEKFFAACDIVVLPYVSATQSGIVQIAFGFGKPVIVTNVGGLPDVVEDGKTGYVVEKGNSVKLAEAIISFFLSKSSVEFEDNIEAERSRFSWENIVLELEGLVGF